MQRAHGYLAVVGFAFITSCHSLSVDERKIIGTWEGHSMDAVWHLTLNPDHTAAVAFDNVVQGKPFFPSLLGSWDLENRNLTVRVDFRSLPGKNEAAERAIKVWRFSISRFGHDQLEVKGNYPLIRVN